ncbi:pitrilysin family protein [Candidatus Venteria ishoeyi]|uniref:M16 family metallopeptidase n=1 Tax=Candidatus Venteria ishoeyi TaxID=1899563 RepID=UPI0025A5D65D|nr:pitrilysin family protein [Candidatus Venteria ishoeyi]MDM8547437.1 pitrilysin family protein [Candidatus Venteria ishoeyi]
MKIRIIILGIAVLLSVLNLTAFAKSGAIYEFQLDNGLLLLVKEDHRAPVVVSQVWYKIGSSYEQAGKTGLSHLLEHMMFKGTAKHGPGEFSRIMAEQGAQENAFTSADYTAYYQKLEKNRLPISFAMEADRMRGLLFDAAAFEKERQVVIEERRTRTDDKPTSLTYEAFKSTAFQTSPYRNPTIGWPSDLKTMKLPDLQDWYRQWYAPNNAIVVVVGDVNPQQVYQLAQKHFGKLKPSTITPPTPRPEVKQHGIKRITVKRPAKLPYLLMGYKVPVLNSQQLEAHEQQDVYALELLAAVLDYGDSARLMRELVRGQEIATTVSASYDLFSRLDDLFVFSGIPAQAYDVQALEQAIRQQIKRLQTEVVSQQALQRIKTQFIANKIYEKDSVFYQAMQLGELAATGLDWRLAEQYIEQVTAITPAQLQSVAKKYFNDERLTVAVLEPQALDKTEDTEQVQ